ncbi:alpha/beta hydrolase, partial [Faecalibacillus intestinalis]|nr:alpha/beta hydrolase [Faecalibacillus intestinalis]
FLPVFVMTANQDFLHDTAVRFDQYLLDRKIPHEFRSYGDSQHPRGHVFHVNQKDPEIAVRCNADEIDFLRRFID